MIETPTWVMNAIAPRSAIAGLRPRPHDLARCTIEARASVTRPWSQEASQGGQPNHAAALRVGSRYGALTMSRERDRDDPRADVLQDPGPRA
jgi:hypothetical protein